MVVVSIRLMSTISITLHKIESVMVPTPATDHGRYVLAVKPLKLRKYCESCSLFRDQPLIGSEFTHFFCKSAMRALLFLIRPTDGVPPKVSRYFAEEQPKVGSIS